MYKPTPNSVKRTRQGPLSKWIAVLVYFLLVEAVWGCLVASRVTADSSKGITDDSAAYVDCARSIVEGRGFQTRVYAGLGAREWEPMLLWPPGYPLLVAGGIKMGLSPFASALAISLIASALSVIVISGIYYLSFQWYLALALSFLTFCTNSFLGISSMLLSEPVFILLSAMSILFLLKSLVERPKQGLFLITSGLIAGLALCVRYAGVIYPPVFVLFILYSFWAKGRRGALTRCGTWLGGWAIGSGWLFTHNLLEYGKLIPYSMPPSERSLFANIYDAYKALLQTTFSLPSMLVRMTSNLIVLSAIAILLGLLMWHFIKAEGGNVRNFLFERRIALFMALIVAAYMGMLVVGRTRYHWGELIDSRYVLPISWMIVFLFGIMCQELLRVLHFSQKRSIAVIILLCAPIIGQDLRIVALSSSRAPFNASFSKRSEIVALANHLPANGVVLSDDMAKLRIIANVNARAVGQPRIGQHALTLEEVSKAFDNGNLSAIVAVDIRGYCNGRFGVGMKDIVCANKLAGQVRRLRVGPAMVLLSKRAK